jgi:hypothetical protein
VKNIAKYIKIFGFTLTIVYIVYLHYGCIHLNIKNAELKKDVQHFQNISDNLYWQLNELIYIIEKNGDRIEKKRIFDTIEEYTNIRHEELKADSISIIDIPKVKFDLKKTKTIFGYHHPLKFEFDENDIIKSISYENYRPKTRLIY